jgi:hypothetical protein
MRYWRKVQRKQYTGEKEQRDNVKEKEKDKVRNKTISMF